MQRSSTLTPLQNSGICRHPISRFKRHPNSPGNRPPCLLVVAVGCATIQQSWDCGPFWEFFGMSIVTIGIAVPEISEPTRIDGGSPLGAQTFSRRPERLKRQSPANKAVLLVNFREHGARDKRNERTLQPQISGACASVCGPLESGACDQRYGLNCPGFAGGSNS